MSKEAEKLILEKTYKESAMLQRIIVLECMLEGFSEVEIVVALKKLIAEGELCVCKTENYIKKV